MVFIELIETLVKSVLVFLSVTKKTFPNLIFAVQILSVSIAFSESRQSIYIKSMFCREIMFRNIP